MIWLNHGVLGATGCVAVALGQVSFPASPSGAEFMTWLGCLLIVAVIARVVTGIMADRRRINESSEPKRTILPTPLEIKNFEELARKHELEKLESEIKDMLKELNNQSEVRIQKVHDRINVIAEEMPGKVIKLLKDTGHLARHIRD